MCTKFNPLYSLGQFYSRNADSKGYSIICAESCNICTYTYTYIYIVWYRKSPQQKVVLKKH